MNWTAFASIISLISLVISLYPLIKSFLNRKRPILSTAPLCTVGHFIGNPDLYLYIDLSNESSRDLKIKSVIMEVVGPNGDLREFPAYAYYGITPQDQNLKAFMPFTIKKGMSWSNNIRFFKPISGENDNNLRQITKMFKETVNKARAEDQSSSKPVDCFAHNPELASMVNELYNINKYWVEGVYKLKLKITTDSIKTNLVMDLSFNLLHVDISTLKELYDTDIVYGASILFPSNNHFVYPSLKNEND
ncbi:TPA: hypothetical protein ACGBIO_003481 [Providencia rettgeri]